MVYIIRVYPAEPVDIPDSPVPAYVEDFGVFRVFQALDKAVDFPGAYALHVIPYGHIENEALRVSQLKFPGDKLYGKPCLYVFLHGLGNPQFRRPFAVVALVRRRNAGLGHRQVLPVQHLHRFQLEKAASGGVGGNDVLGKLGVGPRRRAYGRLQLLPEKLKRLALGSPVQLFHPENCFSG